MRRAFFKKETLERKTKRESFYWILGIVFLILVILIFLIIRGFEDSWILEKNGVYVKHGHPFNTPSYVKEQLDVIKCAGDLYKKANETGVIFNSQCLGRCNNYSIDIVNSFRTSEDDKIDNQCSDYRNKITSNFIELDKTGEIIRII